MRPRSSRRRWSRVFRRDPRSEVDEELHFHVEHRVREYVARGMDRQSARRAALERVGDVERVRNECVALLAAERRAEERRISMSVSWLDVKLGLRMFVKYPGLSGVAVVGMAVAIAISAGFFGFVSSIFDPTLPLDDSGRVVAIQNVDVEEGGRRQSAHDYAVWRDALNGVQDLAAFTTDRRNLIVPGQAVEPVEIARMTASGFRVARTPPLVGRWLLDADERPGAPPVLVLAHDEWQRRFGADPDILGRQVRLGSTVHTVIGVMPEGFHFPVNHRYWTALQLQAAPDPGRGPSLFVFARLADGVTLAQAQSELTAVGTRLAAAYPETHEHLRPRILRYTYAVVGLENSPTSSGMIVQSLVSLLLIVVAVNVAVLVYARTASRAGEIALRTALGGSRTRVVTQLFAEALVLSGTAAMLGLTVAAWALAELDKILTARGWSTSAAGGGLPYWVSFGLSPSLVFYVFGLAIVAAVVVGVLPGLQATGRRAHAELQQLSSRGSQMQLGRTWTTLIVAQVAIAVAVLPYAVDLTATSAVSGMSKALYPVDGLLHASLAVEREEMSATPDTAAYRRGRELRFPTRAAALLRRVEAEPDIAGVAFESRGVRTGEDVRIEIDEAGRPLDAATPLVQAERGWGRSVQSHYVAPSFFTVYDLAMLAGRDFTDADAVESSTAVVVNRAFVEQLLGPGDPIGRRVRYIGGTDDPGSADPERGPWLEIVGVVSNFRLQLDTRRPRVYRATTLDQLSAPVSLIIRVHAPPASAFAARLREITAAVDPTLRLESLQTGADREHQLQRTARLGAFGSVAATASMLLLSAAGISAMMSFIVVRRRREIGIRLALGADARRILGSIFARASAQLAAGVIVGLLLAVTLGPSIGERTLHERGVVLLPLVTGVIIAVGLLAALGPARRGLAVQPSETLREE